MDKSNNEEEERHDILDFFSHEDALPAEYLQKAEVELGETEDRRNQSLKLLRERIYESGCESLKDVDSHFLLMFLRSRKFDVPRAFKSLQRFHRNMRWINTLKNLSALDLIVEIWKDNVIGLMPHRDKAGRAIVVYRPGIWDPEKWNFDEILAAGIAVVSLAILHPMTQVNGYVLIEDLKNLNFGHVRRFTPKHAYIMANVLQDCFPGRFKGIHIVNENVYFRFGYNLLRPFLSAKIKSRFFLHGSDMKSLHKYFDPQLLSSEFDGCQSAFNNSFTIRYGEMAEDKLLSFLKI